MSISALDRKILWGRSGNRCSYPGCNAELDITHNKKHTLVGEECHIEAQSPGGPRYNPNLKNVDSHENLILLCSTHHKVIDSNPERFTVEELKKMKTSHENMISGLLSSNNSNNMNNTVFYESVLDYIDMMLEFNNWRIWVSNLLIVCPVLSDEMLKSIDEIKLYLYSRVWPNTNKEIEDVLMNFCLLLTDFTTLFCKHAEYKNGSWRVGKYYHIQPYVHKRAQMLLKDYKQYIPLLQNLVVELTRMANYICDLRRKNFNPMYRIADGKLLINIGPLKDGCYYTFIPEYKPKQRTHSPYPGIQIYKKVVKTRDLYIPAK